MQPISENNRSKGTKAEDIAANYLESIGYSILKRNFHFGKAGELDIICKDKNTIVFIEVKSRTNFEFGDPVLSMTPSKIKSVRRIAEAYLYVNKIENIECRFDFVGIDLRMPKAEINHIVNAF